MPANNPQHHLLRDSNDHCPASVSVVLVTYNRAHLLDATIGAILAQTMTDFELIIADNASPDHTEQVCRRWALQDGRIRYHRRSTMSECLRI